MDTHDVFNQPEPLVGYNLFEGNRPLRDALKFNVPALDTAALSTLGASLGSAQMQTHARLANIHSPQLHSHDRFGRRIDVVEFHPSYHALMAAAMGAGLHGTPWASPHPNPPPAEEGANAHVQRAAGFMLFTELEPSILCPISMTYAVTPALRGNAAIYADWGSKLASRAYEPALKLWRDKPGLTMGMGMTEKQGGSDVRANTCAGRGLQCLLRFAPGRQLGPVLRHPGRANRFRHHHCQGHATLTPPETPCPPN